MSKRDYSKGKTCPICGKRISNRATFCRSHYAEHRRKDNTRSKLHHYSKKKKCINCGKLITNDAKRCDRCAGLAKRTVSGDYLYSKHKVCANCGKLISNNAVHCRSCSKKGTIRPYMRGSNNPKWNGGWIDYYGPNWYSQRLKALKRDNYKCVLCGTNKGQLNVHHQIPFSKCKNYKEANSL